MPTLDYTSAGSFSNWTVPVGVARITGTVIGAGGSGHSDNDGDDRGGGGGGGGFCRATATVNAGDTIGILVGVGGVPPTDSSQPGSKSEITGPGFYISAGGGGGGTDNNGGGGGAGAGASGSPLSAITFFAGGAGADDDNGGDGGSAATQFGTQGQCGNSLGGAGTNLDGNSTGCPGGLQGQAYGGGGCGRRGGGPTGNGAQGAARIFFNYENPVINFYNKNPTINLTAGDSVNLSWGTTYADNVSISNVGSVAVDGNINLTPSSTTTYTLTARLNATGVQVQQTQTVVVCQLPTASLSVNLTEVSVGDTVTLTWSTTGSEQGGSKSISGVGSLSTNSGSTNVVVNSAGPNTYTLTVVNCSGVTATAEVTVIAYPIPTIDSFTYNPVPALQDTEVTLFWTTTNATGSVSIPGVGSNLPQDSSQTLIATVDQSGPGGYPGAPTYGNGYRDYTLTACNPVNRCVNQSLRVFVTPQPPVASLSITPTTVNLGDTVTLSWSNTYTTSGSINQGVGAISPLNSGTTTFTVTGNPNDFLTNSDKIFTLSVQGYGGVDSDSFSVQVLIDSVPTAWIFSNKTGAKLSTIYYASSNSTAPL